MTTEVPKPEKPLGGKSYGSIAHLPGSRRGPADYGCHEGQARIATAKARDRHDVVIVQEKLDGSNVGVANVDGEIIPIIRSGYRAVDAHYRMHHRFAAWAFIHQDRFRDLLAPGERICGEWLIQAHGTKYALPHEPFVAFDIIKGQERTPFAEFIRRVEGKFTVPMTLHVGGACSIEAALEKLRDRGWHGATEPVEGAVWRVERKGKVDFLAKYVKHGKVDGCYLDGPPVWNTWPGSEDCPW